MTESNQTNMDCNCKSLSKPKNGRPTRYNKETRELIELLANQGMTDEIIAQALKIHVDTLHNWKKKHPEFFESLKSWKLSADGEVEVSLYRRACGYSVPETKVFNNNGEIVTHEVMKHYPPDATSMIFWLKNRQPDKWRDKQEIDIGGSKGLTILTTLYLPPPGPEPKKVGIQKAIDLNPEAP